MSTPETGAAPGAPDWLRELAREATAADGQPPFSDQSLVDLAAGTRTLVGTPGVAAAVFSETELELVVAPGARRAGHGTALATDVLGTNPGVRLAWAHGDHPASRILAQRFGFTPVRTLLQLRAPLTRALSEMQDERASTGSDARNGGDEPSRLLHSWRGGGGVRAFRPGVDDPAWLDLNARAFADHPEQGALTQRDLDARKGESWFNPDDFLLLFDGNELVGSNWLKIDPAHPGLGEIYAISVSPDHQGRGHSRRLMDAGLARLRDRGVTTVSLYVEADNTPALALYERYGFERHTIDVQYSRG